MQRIVEAKEAIREMKWPVQKNGTSIAGGSKALFMGTQTNCGLNNGCVTQRFDPQYAIIMEKVHALAKCCTEELLYLGMYIMQLVKGQGLSQHRVHRGHELYLIYTINIGKYTAGRLENEKRRFIIPTMKRCQRAPHTNANFRKKNIKVFAKPHLSRSK